MKGEVSDQFVMYSQAATNNFGPIKAQIERQIELLQSRSQPRSDTLVQTIKLLEIGSGSGQHACQIAGAISSILWQPADRGDYFAALTANIRAFAAANVLTPRYLDLESWPDEMPEAEFDFVYSANVLHIVRETLIPNLINGAAKRLVTGGRLMIYGPFKYAGKYTSASNASFNEWLVSRDADSGIRDIENIIEMAATSGLALIEDIAMPANNQFLVFGRSSG